MRLSEFLDDIGRPIAYYPQLALCLGSVNAAILLCQMFYWDGKQTDGEGGWIYKKQEELTLETGLSRHESDTARKVLTKKKVLVHKRRGVPPLVHYRINRKALDDLWDNWRKAANQFAGKRQINSPENGKSNSAESGELNCGDAPNQFAAERQNIIAETTAPETTPETTRDDPHTRAEPPAEPPSATRGVGVSRKGSRFKFKQRLEWAEYKDSLPGSIIRDPEAVARARKDGEDDEEIEEYFTIIKPQLEEIAARSRAAVHQLPFEESHDGWPEAPPESERDLRAAELWGQVAERLRKTISEQAFGTWFAPLIPIRLDGSALVLYASNQIIQDWVGGNYASQIKEALSQVSSAETVLTIAWSGGG